MRRRTFVLLAVAMACHDTPVAPRIDAAAQVASAPRYVVKKLSTLSGQSRGFAINNLGWIAGFSTTGSGARHAALWRGDSITDLGTLGGLHSSVAWPGINDSGMVVGIAQTAEPDPLNETWSCELFLPSVGKICVGFYWENNVMTPLPALGGNNGYAAAVNNRGQIVGWAETPIFDPTCNAPQKLQFRAVLWEPKQGRKTALPPLPGDSASAATAIDQAGRVAGISGDCDVAVGRFSARNAVVWDGLTATPLPNLGGISWHTPTAMNDRGDIVGFSNPPGDTGGIFIPRAVLWPKGGGIVNLGRLPDDSSSQASGINARGQIVGVSSRPGSTRAVLWENGVPLDLNTLVGPGFPDSLVTASHINDAGEITGRVFERSTRKTLTYVAIPIERSHD